MKSWLYLSQIRFRFAIIELYDIDDYFKLTKILFAYTVSTYLHEKYPHDKIEEFIICQI